MKQEVVIASQGLDSVTQLVDYNLDVFFLCDCGAAGIVDLSSVHCYENDAKWQETDVSGFNHALQIQILTAVSPGLACSTPV